MTPRWFQYALFYFLSRDISTRSEDCVSDRGGGALFFYGSIVRIQDDTLFDSNTAVTGGAIFSYLHQPFNLTIEGKNISFANNVATGKPAPIDLIRGAKSGGGRREQRRKNKWVTVMVFIFDGGRGRWNSCLDS